MRLFANEYSNLYANLCEYFEAKYELNDVNKWCLQTETCEYEANKIRIRLD